MMPDKPGGDGAVRTPGLAEFFQAFRRRALAELLHLVHRRGQSQISDWPNVGPAQRTQQIDVRGPISDAFEDGEHFTRGIVVQFVEVTEIEVAAGERFGEQSSVESFLAAEADAKQLRVSKLQEAAWCERADGGVEPIESGFRGSEGDLLFEDDVDERGEAGLADPEGRLPVLFHDRSEMGIAIREKTHTLREKIFVRDGLRGLQGEIPLDP